MGGSEKQEYPPLLAVGFHPYNLVGLRRLCVDRFPESITRRRVMENLDALTALVNQSGVRGELWIDGSFTTSKLNPDDVDLVFAVSWADYQALDDKQRQFCEWFRTTSLYDRYRCDNYFLLQRENSAVSDWMNAYWLRQFGFSRADEMKGLAVVRVPYVVLP
jgi:hypothetical protein